MIAVGIEKLCGVVHVWKKSCTRWRCMKEVCRGGNACQCVESRMCVEGEFLCGRRILYGVGLRRPNPVPELFTPTKKTLTVGPFGNNLRSAG